MSFMTKGCEITCNKSVTYPVGLSIAQGGGGGRFRPLPVGESPQRMTCCVCTGPRTGSYRSLSRGTAMSRLTQNGRSGLQGSFLHHHGVQQAVPWMALEPPGRLASLWRPNRAEGPHTPGNSLLNATSGT